MKRLKAIKNKKVAGFTLVELLMVIAVIIILTGIGLIIYTNVQRSTRDAKRKGDVKAIATAMETQFTTKGDYLTPLSGESFASGVVPAPAEGGNYLISYGEANKGFQVCAALENHPVGTACDTSVSTCFCVVSLQETYIAVAPTPTASPTITPTSSPTSTPTGTPTASPTSSPTPSPTSTPSSVTKFAGSAANTTGYGITIWANVGNIFTEDGVPAVAGIGSHGIVYTNYLDATNFGFNIPAGATITGITVEIKKESHYTTTPIVINDDKVLILKGGVMGTVNKAEAANWSTSGLAYSTYGGVSDLWGISWTPADINSSTFGVRLTAKATLAFAWVDAVRITVYYTN
ncbi:MAG: prepilin-type N-terminal cleavage/methylation domain-containing protein [Candidatus Daviesbacteria bacterium]|nr:prepilin-type N-terminal cleavage/methylation domain-containing protein [Candidatus Daviesbacteria bacterium]